MLNPEKTHFDLVCAMAGGTLPSDETTKIDLGRYASQITFPGQYTDLCPKPIPPPDEKPKIDLGRYASQITFPGQYTDLTV